MIGTTAISSVRSMDLYTIMTTRKNNLEKTAASTPLTRSHGLIGQGAAAPGGKRLEGAMLKFRENLQNFTFREAGLKDGIIEDKVHETSVALETDNVKSAPSGALSGFQANLRKFASEVLCGEGVRNRKPSESAAESLRKNIQEANNGPAAGIKKNLQEYAKASMESRKPPVKLAEPVKIFWRDNPYGGAGEPDKIQGISVLV